LRFNFRLSLNGEFVLRQRTTKKSDTEDIGLRVVPVNKTTALLIFTIFIGSLSSIGLATLALWRTAVVASAVSAAETPPNIRSAPDREREDIPVQPSANVSAAAVTKLIPVPKSLEATVAMPTFQLSVDKAELEAESFRVANQLLAARPNDAQAIHVAAVCNSQFQKTAEAQELWLKCIELSPTTETYYLNVAANALFRGETELALATLEKAIANGIRSADISHHMGLALTRLGDDEKAVEVLQQAINSDSNLAAHWMLLGQSQLKLNRLPDAKVSLNRAVALGVRNRAVYLALLNTSMRLGEKEEAAKYREIVDAAGDKPTDDGRERFRTISEREAKRVLLTVLGEACVVYRDAGLLEDAEHTALRLLAHEPDNYGTCLFLAEMYHRRNMPAEELIARQRMLEINPSEFLNQLHVARILADAGYPQRCEGAIKLVISIAPQKALGYAAMAEFLQSQGLANRAQWYAEQALDRERSPAGFKLLASILRSQGKEAEAQSIEKSAANNQR
jgi:tetratricopeptide (TPR) repeat protein